MRSVWILLALSCVMILWNCTPRNALAEAAFRGDRDGTEAGQKEGYADGYAAAFPAARDEVYASMLARLYEQDRFQRKPWFTSMVLVVGFFVGGALQFLLLYFARRWGLTDIDRIVLSRDLTRVNLEELKAGGKGPPASGIGLMLLLVMSLSLPGCKNAVEEQYSKSYKAAYASAYPEGKARGENMGSLDGGVDGMAAAQRVAAGGTAWQLYFRPGMTAIISGVLLGLALQYAVLFGCRSSGRIDQLQSVVFVPAMRRSLAYAIFQSCLELKLMEQESLRRMSADSTVKKNELETAYDTLRLRIQASTSIEELTHARIVELADEEFTRIIAGADAAAKPENRRPT